MEQTILLYGAFFAVAVGMLLVLGSGDLRRRQVANRRRWLRDRYHAAVDRVEAFKLELEPPLDGVPAGSAVLSPRPKTPPSGKPESGKPDSDASVPESAESPVSEAPPSE